MLPLLHSATYMPYQTAFFDWNEISFFSVVLDWIFNVIFFMDIVINFFSAIKETDGSIIHNRK